LPPDKIKVLTVASSLQYRKRLGFLYLLSERCLLKNGGNESGRSRVGIYNLYGYVIAVEGPVDKIFNEEYWFFKTLKDHAKIDLFVKVNKGLHDLPTKFWGSNKGM